MTVVLVVTVVAREALLAVPGGVEVAFEEELVCGGAVTVVCGVVVV